MSSEWKIVQLSCEKPIEPELPTFGECAEDATMHLDSWVYSTGYLIIDDFVFRPRRARRLWWTLAIVAACTVVAAVSVYVFS